MLRGGGIDSPLSTESTCGVHAACKRAETRGAHSPWQGSEPENGCDLATDFSTVTIIRPTPKSPNFPNPIYAVDIGNKKKTVSIIYSAAENNLINKDLNILHNKKILIHISTRSRDGII